MLPCQYKQLLGIDCPICGLQRSIIAVLHGEYYKSFMLFPGLACTCLVIICYFLHKILANKFILNCLIVLCVCDLVIIIVNWIFKLVVYEV